MEDIKPFGGGSKQEKDEEKAHRFMKQRLDRSRWVRKEMKKHSKKKGKKDA